MDLLNHLQQLPPNWLMGYDTNQFKQLTFQLYHQLSQLNPTPKILLAERKGDRFLPSFLAAVAANCSLFLINPDLAQQEWQEVLQLVQPDLILGTNSKTIPPKTTATSPSSSPSSSPPQIMIPTGGSSGKIRFAIHTWSSLAASVEGFTQYFPQTPVNSYCILPLYHVSGLMQFIRSFLTGGQLLIQPYKVLKAAEEGEINQINLQDFFISLVPTQLQYLIETKPHWLCQFHTVLVGGAPTPQSLLDKARKAKIRLAPTYGMTETGSQVVTLQPNDFLAGNNSSGQVLPHAAITIRSETGEILPPEDTGIIAIEANSLFSGYYGQSYQNITHFITDDLGYLDNCGYLHVMGRRNRKIITGGENVFPTEVEEAILATGLVEDVCVLGLADHKWGEAVTAVYVAGKDISATMETALRNKLSKYKIPRYWVRIDTLPRNSQGKINYLLLRWQIMDKIIM